MVRTLTILVITAATALAGGLGLNNGMVLVFDDDHGHLVLEVPLVHHAQEHATGADHDADHHGHDADHANLHDLIASSSTDHLTIQKVAGSPDGLNAAHLHFPTLDLWLTPALGSLLQCPAGGAMKDAANFRGGTAHIEHACLRSVVLLV